MAGVAGQIHLQRATFDMLIGKNSWQKAMRKSAVLTQSFQGKQNSVTEKMPACMLSAFLHSMLQ
jgi:hypothetical protein